MATRHTTHTYGCSVPRLTRFVPDARMGPDREANSISQKSRLSTKKQFNIGIFWLIIGVKIE